MTSRRWRWVSARGSADQPLAHCAESAAAHIRPVSGRQAELAPQTCLIKAGTLLNIWHITGRTRASARSGKLCVDLRLDQKIDGASGCLHSCMHCGEAQGDTMEACVHRMLYCSAVQSSVDEFRSQDFGLKLNWEAPMGSDLVLFCLQNGTLIRPASTRFVIGLQSHACSAESICAGRVYGGGWIYGGWIWS
jgi:hypothetical protein